MVGSGGEQRVEEEPGLERVEESGRDQAAFAQVAFGAGKGVGGRENGTGACSGGQHDGDVLGEAGKRRDEMLRDVAGAERGDDKPVDPLAETGEDRAVAAEGDRDQGDRRRRAVPRRRDHGAVFEVGQQRRVALDEVTERPAIG